MFGKLTLYSLGSISQSLNVFEFSFLLPETLTAANSHLITESRSFFSSFDPRSSGFRNNAVFHVSVSGEAVISTGKASGVFKATSSLSSSFCSTLSHPWSFSPEKLCFLLSLVCVALDIGALFAGSRHGFISSSLTLTSAVAFSSRYPSFTMESVWLE